MNPKVSIILPCYNSNISHLSVAIFSVLEQSFNDFELIIIDDCSDNNLFDAVNWFWDNRIKFIRNDRNLMYVKCLILWVNLAWWEYIARIDDDDIWEDKNKLRKQIDFLEKNPSYWLVWTNVHLLDYDWNTLDQNWEIYYSDSDIRSHILWWCPFIHSSVLFKKECISELWNYDVKYTLAEDYELWMRIWLKYKFFNLRECFVWYRINPYWVSHKYHCRQILMAYKAAFKYSIYYPNSCYYLVKRILKFPMLYLSDFIKYCKVYIMKIFDMIKY